MFERHGDIDSSLYNKWRIMRYRCRHNKAYIGRKVCSSWDTNYISFKEWSLSNGYEEGLTIDRIDNQGDYEPTNCRYITLSSNTSRPRKYNEEELLEIEELLSEKVKHREIAVLYGISRSSVSRINKSYKARR